eukprot:g24430.t1
MDPALLERAAELGNAEAQYALGAALLTGHGRPKDPAVWWKAKDLSRAVELCRLAAKQNHAAAQCNLGVLYAQGLGVEQDYERARSFYDSCSELDQRQSQPFEEASANQGDPNGCFNLALLYAEGVACDKDFAKAASLARSARDLGHPEAAAFLETLPGQDEYVLAQLRDLRARSLGLEEADCNEWKKCPDNSKYYLGQEGNAQGMVCASTGEEAGLISEYQRGMHEALSLRNSEALMPALGELQEHLLLCEADVRGLPMKSAPFVSVAVRIRPSLCEDPVSLWADLESNATRVCCHRGYLLEEYEFTRVFGPDEENRKLFEDLQDEVPGPALTDSVFSGVNETLFAYGQTGSGKTHTIFGSASELGLLQLFVRQVFQGASHVEGVSVHVCCYEIVAGSLTEDDIVYDELFIKTQRCRYQICHVRSAEQCLSLLHLARRRRTSGVSSQNSDSSRSHAMVHLFVQTPGPHESSAIGTLTLEHENPSEQGRKSARLLNTSLCSLNRLLRKLQMGCLEESERRQSVLNKCLWEYLRPGCGIALIFCVSPLLAHRSASLSTLAMATDRKAIHSQRKSQFIPVSPSHVAEARVNFSPSGAPHMAQNRTPRSSSRRPTFGMPGMEDLQERKRHGRLCLGGPWSAGGLQEEALTLGVEDTGHLQRTETGAGSSSYQFLAFMIARVLTPRPKRAARKDRSERRRYERLRQEVERAHEELSNDNQSLKRECESLRTLFVRQQKQQIDFWTGPFLEMLGEQPAAQAMAKQAATNAREAIAAVRRGGDWPLADGQVT